jgi:hypothetical protein
MGYWSVFTSVDKLDEHCDYTVAGASADEALQAAERVLPKSGRVVVRRDANSAVVATTVRHTPAWAWAAAILPVLFVRFDRTATITVTEESGGAVLHARGKLDTRAASRLRALRTAAA